MGWARAPEVMMGKMGKMGKTNKMDQIGKENPHG